MPDYVAAEDVKSPRRHWSLIAVLDDPKKPKTCVLALGLWKGQPRLAMRWNGFEGMPLGNPQSRGIPTWFIIGDQFNDVLIDSLASDETRKLVRSHMPRVG